VGTLVFTACRQTLATFGLLDMGSLTNDGISRTDMAAIFIVQKAGQDLVRSSLIVGWPEHRLHIEMPLFRHSKLHER
jgi:hypothetical protein